MYASGTDFLIINGTEKHIMIIMTEKTPDYTQMRGKDYAENEKVERKQ